MGNIALLNHSHGLMESAPSLGQSTLKIKQADEKQK
jgi:hypothetical protein